MNTEIADLKKKAVIANPYCACCDVHGRDIDKLNAEIAMLLFPKGKSLRIQA